MRSLTASFVALCLTGGSMLLGAAPAVAGGGCDAATHGTGDVVVMAGACFAPSIIHVSPGTTVVFLNKDPFAHNVSAPEWGHYDDLSPSERFAATFTVEGIYPFACMIHPGMTGAVVVGDGTGPGNGATSALSVTAAELANEAPSSTPAPAAFAVADRGSDHTAAVVALALFVGVAVGLGLAAIRRRAVAN